MPRRLDTVSDRMISAAIGSDPNSRTSEEMIGALGYGRFVAMCRSGYMELENRDRYLLEGLYVHSCSRSEMRCLLGIRKPDKFEEVLRRALIALSYKINAGYAQESRRLEQASRRFRILYRCWRCKAEAVRELSGQDPLNPSECIECGGALEVIRTEELISEEPGTSGAPG